MKPSIERSILLLSNPEGLKRVYCRQEEPYLQPSIDAIKELIQLLRAVLLPGHFNNKKLFTLKNANQYIIENVNEIERNLFAQVKVSLCLNDTEQDFNSSKLNKKSKKIIYKFITRLPKLRKTLYSDILATYNSDLTAKSRAKIAFSFPELRAISSYRIAHTLLKLNVPTIPYIITELARTETGIDIHPGAKIGKSFMIDHGTGVIIGETTRIGKNVKIHQGVTLGAKSIPLYRKGKSKNKIKRHPKIGDNVIIYSNSTILGKVKVGKDAVIGGNIWLDKSVKSGKKILQKKSRIKIKNKKTKEHQKNIISIPEFRVCKGCHSHRGCRRCILKYEDKYGVSVK